MPGRAGEKNRKRRMRRHLRDNPNDVAVRKEFEKTYGLAKSQGISCRGNHKLKHAAKLARVA